MANKSDNMKHELMISSGFVSMLDVARFRGLSRKLKKLGWKVISEPYGYASPTWDGSTKMSYDNACQKISQ